MFEFNRDRWLTQTKGKWVVVATIGVDAVGYVVGPFSEREDADKFIEQWPAPEGERYWPVPIHWYTTGEED